jgi:hypothetical protein
MKQSSSKLMYYYYYYYYYYSTDLLELGRIFSFLILYTVGRVLRRGISPCQSYYLHTGQHKRGMNTHRHDTSSGIRTHNPSVWAGEDSSRLRPRSHCDMLELMYYHNICSRGWVKARKKLYPGWVSKWQLSSSDHKNQITWFWNSNTVMGTMEIVEGHISIYWTAFYKKRCTDCLNY